LWAGWCSRYNDWLWAGRSGDRITVGARFSAPVQTGPRAQPASCTMGTGSFPRVKGGRGVTLTPHPLLVPWSWKSRAIPLLPLWAVQPVQSPSACTRVHFTYLHYNIMGSPSYMRSVVDRHVVMRHILVPVLQVIGATDSDSSVQRTVNGLDIREIGLQFPAGTRNFSLLQSVQTFSEALPASCSKDTGGPSLKVKASGAWSWPLTSIWCRG